MLLSLGRSDGCTAYNEKEEDKGEREKENRVDRVGREADSCKLNRIYRSTEKTRGRRGEKNEGEMQEKEIINKNIKGKESILYHPSLYSQPFQFPVVSLV